jgi:cellulose synthase/poly-beta-1,6-N-acetylglucosamine synthase-like glycosyltransferase
MISVALCTYNGSRFLAEQLASIAAQTRPVDEVVVCDDRSGDDTVAQIQHWASGVPFPVRIEVNETNLGSTKNFEKALSLCRGEVLFCCDQDDIWRADKVAVLTAYLDAHPAKEAVFSDGLIIDDASRPTGSTLFQQIEFTPARQAEWRAGRGYETLFGSYVVTGATLALRRRVLPRLMPFPQAYAELIHDGWIALVLSLTDAIGFVEVPLISYRQHTQQQVGFGKKARWVTLRDRFSRPRAEKLQPLRTKTEHAGALLRLLEAVPGVPPEKLDALRQRLAHFRRRSTLPAPRWRRVAPVLQEWQSGRYRLSSPQWWKPLLGDLLE